MEEQLFTPDSFLSIDEFSRIMVTFGWYIVDQSTSKANAQMYVLSLKPRFIKQSLNVVIFKSGGIRIHKKHIILELNPTVEACIALTMLAKKSNRTLNLIFKFYNTAIKFVRYPNEFTVPMFKSQIGKELCRNHAEIFKFIYKIFQEKKIDK